MIRVTEEMAADEYFNNKPKTGMTCNICKKSIGVVLQFRLCNEHLEEVMEENARVKAATGKPRELTDEEFKLYFLPPDEKVN